MNYRMNRVKILSLIIMEYTTNKQKTTHTPLLLNKKNTPALASSSSAGLLACGVSCNPSPTQGSAVAYISARAYKQLSRCPSGDVKEKAETVQMIYSRGCWQSIPNINGDGVTLCRGLKCWKKRRSCEIKTTSGTRLHR